MPVEIPPAERRRLVVLFQECRYDRVLIDCILEGRFGRAYTDSMRIYDLPFLHEY